MINVCVCVCQPLQWLYGLVLSRIQWFSQSSSAAHLAHFSLVPSTHELRFIIIRHLSGNQILREAILVHDSPTR